MHSVQQLMCTHPCSCCPRSAGYGGPYCQGTMRTVPMSSGDSFATGKVAVAPGQWVYYYIKLDQSLRPMGGLGCGPGWWGGRGGEGGRFVVGR